MSVAQMEAGRELDALVAERVMGFAWEPPIDGPGRTAWLTPPHSHMTVASRRPDGTVVPSRNLKAYSTTWDGAGLVVEAMRGKGFAMALDMEVGPEGEALYGVTFWNGRAAFFDDSGEAPTAPLAICRAALAAMEAQQEEKP